MNKPKSESGSARVRFRRAAAALVLLAALLLLCPSCEKTETSDFTYQKNDEGYTLISVKALGRDVVIPAEYNGEKVTWIGKNAFFNNDTIRRLTVPKSVAIIEEYAFSSCVKLNTVVFEEGGRCVIGEGAFSKNPLLETLTLNSSVSVFDARAFENCPKLGRVQMDESVKSIARDAFKNCESLLIDAPAGSIPDVFAKENGIPSSFVSSDAATYLTLLAALAAAGALFGVFLIIEKRRKRGKTQKKS